MGVAVDPESVRLGVDASLPTVGLDCPDEGLNRQPVSPALREAERRCLRFMILLRYEEV
jgi:hypothetical protein